MLKPIPNKIQIQIQEFNKNSNVKKEKLPLGVREVTTVCLQIPQ